MTTLLIVSAPDIASTIQGDALLARGNWNPIADIEGCNAWKHEIADIHLWWFSSGILMEDYLDLRFKHATGIEPKEVIFLSRHYAASGRPSLTLHVIGVPGELPHGEKAEFVGEKGVVVLPNPRFAAWYRLMCSASERHNLIPEFEMTIETTHHGPLLETPTMFIEIGSSESHWERRDAAEAWADVIGEAFGLEGDTPDPLVSGDWWSLTRELKEKQQVMIGIGGGHYAPRHTDVLRKTNCWAGHQIANYALEMERPENPEWDPDEGDLPNGPWNHSIRTCVESTRVVFEGAKIIAHLDRKSFKGWQRRVIKRLLAELSVPVGRTSDFE